jgi:uncharacterized membrane protein YoaK (UPF0700 family)
MNASAEGKVIAPAVRLILLAVAAGCVDAVSYLGLGGVLTAAMTGNTVLLGLAVGSGELRAAARSCIALAGFMLGAMLAADITGRGARRLPWSRTVTAAFVLELIVLVMLAIAWHLLGPEASSSYRYFLIGAAGIAMGIQSVAVHRLGVEGISTTYITGTLTNSATRLDDWLRSLRKRRSAVSADSTLHPSRSGSSMGARSLGFPVSVWIAYGFGATVAGAVKLWWSSLSPPVFGPTVALGWPSAALIPPIVLVAIVIAMALRR